MRISRSMVDGIGKATLAATCALALFAAPARAIEPVTTTILVAKGIAWLFGGAKVVGAAKGAAAAAAATKGTIVTGTAKGASAIAASKGAVAVSTSPVTSQAVFINQTTILAPKLATTRISGGLVSVGSLSVPVGKITVALVGLGLAGGEAEAFNGMVIPEIAAAAEMKRPYHVKFCREKDGNAYALPSRGLVCMDGSTPLMIDKPIDAAALIN